MLFVTEQVYQLLGISGEKFIKTFQEINRDFKEEWSKAVNQLSLKNESKVILSMKTSARNRNGSDMRFRSRYPQVPFAIMFRVLIFPKLTLIRALLRKKTPLSH